MGLRTSGMTTLRRRFVRELVEREDLTTVQYVLRKMFVEEGTGLAPEPTLFLAGSTFAERDVWALRQLRGAKKRVRLSLEGNPMAYPGTGRTQFIAELSHHLRSGTFVSLDLGDASPMCEEMAEMLSKSRGLRTLGLLSYQDNREYNSLVRALSSPLATKDMETIYASPVRLHTVPKQTPSNPVMY